MERLNKRQSRAIAWTLALVMILSCFAVLGTNAYAAETTKKMPYKSGDKIDEAVFYIGVDTDKDGKLDDTYYYTQDEIKAYNDEVAYHYDNHSVGETSNVKGAKLTNLINDMGGTKVEDDWTIQFMEYDAYHATNEVYQDTVASLTDPAGKGNGSGYPGAAETIIGYSCKTIFDKPDENNVNDTDYVSFTDYKREASPVRAYRQTASANGTVIKTLMGVVISGDPSKYDGQTGYTLQHYSERTGNIITDNAEILGLVSGMEWPAAPKVDIPWADLSAKDKQEAAYNGVSTVVTIKDKSTDTVVKYNYKEKTFANVINNGKTTALDRSALIAKGDKTFPETDTFDGTKYKYYGFNKPMYVRYQGAWLKEVIGKTTANDKVYITDANGKSIDVTKKLDDYFVAYAYTESKSSTNIDNGKRVPIYYDYSVIIDTASAPIEYSNVDTDYTAASKKMPTTYLKAKDIKVVTAATEPALKAPAVKVAKSGKAAIKVSYTNVSGESGYQIYKSTKKTSGFTKLKTMAANKTSYTDKKVKAGKAYYYKVRAYKKTSSQTVYGPWSTVKGLKR